MIEGAAVQAVDAAGHAALDLVGLEAGAQVLWVHAGGAVRLEAVGALRKKKQMRWPPLVEPALDMMRRSAMAVLSLATLAV